MGLNQTKMAHRMKMSLSTYARREAGDGAISMVAGGPVELHDLKPHEYCYIRRRRAGKTQAQVAAELNCCRWWVNQMERGLVSTDELEEFWNE